MLAPYTIFGKTKMVEVEVWLDNKIIQSEEWDDDLWVERGEDMYALMAMKNKRVRVIRREVWLRSQEQRPTKRAVDGGY